MAYLKAGVLWQSIGVTSNEWLHANLGCLSGFVGVENADMIPAARVYVQV